MSLLRVDVRASTARSRSDSFFSPSGSSSFSVWNAQEGSGESRGWAVKARGPGSTGEPCRRSLIPLSDPLSSLIKQTTQKALSQAPCCARCCPLSFQPLGLTCPQVRSRQGWKQQEEEPLTSWMMFSSSRSMPAFTSERSRSRSDGSSIPSNSFSNSPSN